MRLALRYAGHRCEPGDVIVPWYFAGSLALEVGEVFEVPRAEGILLGRGRNADVCVASNGVARLHAQVKWSEDGDALVARDLDSTNGTTSSRGNGSQHRLIAGDRLTLAGRFDFDVVELGDHEG